MQVEDREVQGVAKRVRPFYTLHLQLRRTIHLSLSKSLSFRLLTEAEARLAETNERYPISPRAAFRSQTSLWNLRLRSYMCANIEISSIKVVYFNSITALRGFGDKNNVQVQTQNLSTTLVFECYFIHPTPVQRKRSQLSILG